MYALGSRLPVDRIAEKWMEAEKNPIEPRVVESAPVQEVVHIDKDLLEPSRAGRIPVADLHAGFR